MTDFLSDLFADGDELFVEQRSRHSEDLADQFVSDIPGSRRSLLELGSDEAFTNPLHNRNLGSKGGIEYGKIVYSQPYTNWYRVQLDDLGGDLPCCRLTETASLPFSVRDTAPIAAGASVAVWVPEEIYFGYIIGVIPDKVESGALVYPDWISQGSNCGIKRDAYYRELFELTAQDGGVIDFSNSRPLDALSNGEWGRFTDLGGGIHIDMFMAFLRMDETCGLWLFYLDKLARLAAYNFDLQTSISEMIVRNDNGEGQHYSGSTPYPWEALGHLVFGEDVAKEESDFDVQYKLPRGKLEPSSDYRYPFYRLEEFRGYLGQGFMRQLRYPDDKDGKTNTILTTFLAGKPGERTRANPALFREHISLDGAYALSSAHSISLVKRMILPAGKRIAPAESTRGDKDTTSATGYKFAGINGAGPDHKINSPTGQGPQSPLHEAMAVSDFTAHSEEWRALHPFQYHEDDFDTPEQSSHGGNTGNGMESIQSPLNFSALKSQTHLDRVESVKLDIDHRYGEVDYFPVTAGVFLLPEGGVVIRDGQGGEIRMVGGSMQISCPGDVWLQPGRNINLLAGDDLIARAVNSMDFTVTEHDIRFKAQTNMEFVAAVSGNGRMLFENQAKSNFQTVADNAVGETIEGSGFIFKAAHSDFITACRGIYLRTGSDDVDEGPIVLDAAKGKNDIRSVSRVFHRHIESFAQDAFPVEGKKDIVNSYSSVNAQIQTSCQFDGGLFVTKNGMTIKGEVGIIGGHIGTEFAERFNGQVGVLKGESLKKTKEVLQDTLDGMEKARDNAKDDFENFIEKLFYDEDKLPGSTAFQDASSFSLRTAGQMNTTSFKFAETYWQQLARATGNIPGTWTEKSIDYRGRTMMPYPGLAAWTSSASWLTQELKAFDPLVGLDEERGDGFYEDFKYETIGETTPDGTYPIVSSTVAAATPTPNPPGIGDLLIELDFGLGEPL